MSLPSQDKAETLVLADIPSSSILSTHTFEMGQPILQVSALEGFGSSASGDPWSTVAIAPRRTKFIGLYLSAAIQVFQISELQLSP
ncbi:hypothetical protein BX666DRAFT_1284355 [Dichotomocladium elegans]|nr:hypothetical protein BX666DRAFT_1284355 [Dichotomocladium elegans]